MATFDLGLGTIQRKKANKNLYEVPAQKWVDITDKSKNYGVSIFSDSKYGWIMKDQSSLRLTVVHSPKHYFRNDSVQGMLDFGLNRYGYAIYSHTGDYTNGTQLNARFFNQPMAAFVSSKHDGVLGDEYSFGSISDSSVIIRALKKAEDTDEIIVRVNEGAGKPAMNTTVSLADGILSAREVYASEEEIGPANVTDGKLVFDLAPYEVKTFALTLSSCLKAGRGEQKPASLPFNKNIVTFNNNKGETFIPKINVSVPGELFPKNFDCTGIRFETADGNLNGVICQGQKVRTQGTRLYFVAASLNGDKVFNFGIGDGKAAIKIQSIEERIGGWDLYNLGETAFVKTDKLAWESTHCHGHNKDEVAKSLYFFMYEIFTDNVDEITLPDDEDLLIIAATEVFESRDVRLNTPLYDRIEKRPFDYTMTRSEKRRHNKNKRKSRKTPNQS